MQAVALVTGDEFLARYNLTIDTSDILDYITKLTWGWSTLALIHIIHFDNYYGVDFSLMIGPTGFCYNFNIVDAAELFYLDK